MRVLTLTCVIILGAWTPACGGSGDKDDSTRADASAGAVCGDNMCSSSENCVTCSADCGACPPGCGDNSCNGTETCESCSADCGVCTCDPSDPFSCSGEEVCIGTSCVSAFGRTYTISVFNLTVKTTSPSGETWDAVGGAPDPFVVVSLSDSTVLTTAEATNTFTPTFSESVDVVIPAGAKFRFEAWDSDIASNDPIIACEVDPLTADFLRAYGPVCSGAAANGTDGTVLDILIAPK